MTAETQQVQHTPGPWETSVDRRGPGPYFGGAYGDAQTYPYFVTGADGFMVASVFGDGTRNRGLTEANARLIASAPDLLAALEIIEDCCGFAQGDIDTGDYRLAYDKVTEARQRAVVAIRKARGEDA
jgi:hypothetical protein